MKKNHHYEKPALEAIALQSEDILADSTESGEGGLGGLTGGGVIVTPEDEF